MMINKEVAVKNKSTLAKLLAEEDIFVVHKKMDTAYFNPKSRELGLPIWKDEEMTKDIYDLMVCHEIAHALWTPLDMLEKAQVRKINHSFVNIVEDARIERMVQDRYPGSVAVFNRGYRDLTAKDFFGIADKDVSELNLIDRINLFFKKQKVEFTAEEKVWVKRVAETKTPDDVLDLAEELYAWMAENAPEEESDDEKSMPDPNGESGEGEEGETGEGDAPADDEGEEDGNDVPAGGADEAAERHQQRRVQDELHQRAAHKAHLRPGGGGVAQQRPAPDTLHRTHTPPRTPHTDVGCSPPGRLRCARATSTLAGAARSSRTTWLHRR